MQVNKNTKYLFAVLAFIAGVLAVVSAQFHDLGFTLINLCLLVFSLYAYIQFDYFDGEK